MKQGLLFRLDDIAPGLSSANLARLEKIFDQYNIKPLMGVVPQNQDDNLIVQKQEEETFWQEVKRLTDKGWAVSMHGFCHVYCTQESGLLKANPFSEFAGLDYQTQSDKLKEGRELLQKHGIDTDCFMAPGHTFDINTLKALKENGFKYVTDGYTDYPYRREGLLMIPCTLTDPAMITGCDTVCIHLNNWKDCDFERLESFLKDNSDICGDWNEVMRDGEQAREYDTAVAKAEAAYIRKRDIKRAAAENETMQRYLKKSYSSNKPVKLLKRCLFLPMLIPNVIKALLFVLILLFLLRSVSYILRTNGDTKDRFAGFYAQQRDSVDVFLMGSSTVGTSFSPAYMWGNFGFTSYPLSSNSQRPLAIKYLIEEGLKYQKPSLVVVELRTFMADDDELASDEGHVREVVDNMKYSPLRIKTINAMTEKFDDKYAFYFDIIKYHSNVGELLARSEWKKFNYCCEDPDKGYEMLYHTENYREFTPDLYTEERLPIPKKQEQVLRDLLAYLKQQKLEALFVVTPRDSEPEYEQMMNYCSDIITAEGFDYIDMNFMYDEMGFDYRYDIDDGAHTNAWGAQKCSKVLGEYINDNYEINRNYDKKVIENWDEAYSHYLNEFEALVPEDKYH